MASQKNFCQSGNATFQHQVTSDISFGAPGRPLNQFIDRGYGGAWAFKKANVAKAVGSIQICSTVESGSGAVVYEFPLELIDGIEWHELRGDLADQSAQSRQWACRASPDLVTTIVSCASSQLTLPALVFFSWTSS